MRTDSTVPQLQWYRSDDDGNPLPDGKGAIDRFNCGIVSITVEVSGNGYRADICGRERHYGDRIEGTRELCRGVDIEVVKRDALRTFSDELQRMRDAVVLALGDDNESA